MMTKLNFHIISMATYGVGLSGGDRIWIELSKIISKKYQVNVYLWEEGQAIAKREGLDNVNYQLWSAKLTSKLGFCVNYFARVIIGVIKAANLRIENCPETIVYSASEFWQDSLPAVILKIRYPKIKWVAAWYQTAPNLFVGYTEGSRGSRYRLKAFLYWFVQLPIKPLINHLADLVIVNNESERKQFPEMAKKDQLLVMLGAVDLEKVNEYRSKHKNVGKMYGGVFQGRFHPQKGVLELIDIWKLIARVRPNAKLAIIGDGPLMKDVKLKIKNEKLENSIQLFGYLFDGPEKYKIFLQSKVVLHPAFYDSGGMASAEAMAFGIPLVGFDLKSYESYYPMGMVKVKIGDIKSFAQEVLNLLNNDDEREGLGKQALEMLNENWSWQSRVDSLINKLNHGLRATHQR